MWNFTLVVYFQVDGLCWEKGSADSENAYDETKECTWRVSGNRKIVGSDDPWQLGLQQAVAMWAERTDPGIRGSSSDATATLCLCCSTQTSPSRGRVFICHRDMEGCTMHAAGRLITLSSGIILSYSFKKIDI